MVEHGHDLDAVLGEWAGEGVSLRAIAARLASRYGIEVAHTTIERWLGYPG
jgi:transposase-like protein